MNTRSMIHRQFIMQPGWRAAWLRTLAAIEALPEYRGAR